LGHKIRNGANIVNIAYYITGHGYGHTVRSIEVIKELYARQEDLTVHVRTSAPQWLFAELAGPAFVYHSLRLDVGALQSNSFYVDKERTLRAYAELAANKKDLVHKEIEFLQQQDVQLILSDITPLAFEAAAALGIPGIGESNFSWDWIYADWLNDFPDYVPVIQDIRNSYSLADLLLRIPFYGDMSAFRHIKDIPLISRRSALSKDQARDVLSGFVTTSKPLILLGLRRADLEHIPLEAVRKLADVQFITTAPDLHAPNITWIPEGNLPYQDLIKGVDLVLSKPGYSIVSEIIGNQTPVAFVARNDFCEDPLLRQGLLEYAVCEEMSMQDFNQGNWQATFETLLTKPRQWRPMDCNGAQVAAEMILSFR
jgi:hypothetical protein